MTKMQIRYASAVAFLLVAVPAIEVVMSAAQIGPLHSVAAFIGFVLFALLEGARDYSEA